MAESYKPGHSDCTLCLIKKVQINLQSSEPVRPGQKSDKFSATRQALNWPTCFPSQFSTILWYHAHIHTLDPKDLTSMYNIYQIFLTNLFIHLVRLRAPWTLRGHFDAKTDVQTYVQIGYQKPVALFKL